jgi:hypothetical protein
MAANLKFRRVVSALFLGGGDAVSAEFSKIARRPPPRGDFEARLPNAARVAVA